MNRTIDRPAVSVCVPTRNQGSFLGQALRSVLAQTRQDFEIIVSDDASSDGTLQVVAGIGDARIRYHYNRVKLGIPRNRDRCLALARGRYIAWLDSDDEYQPEMLEAQTAVLDRHADVGLVHGAFQVVDERGRRMPDWPLPFANDVIEAGTDAFRELVLLNYVTTSTVMVRRECHDRVGPHAADVGRSSSDWEMWLRLALHTRFAYTARPLARYRVHPSSISAVAAGPERLRCDVAVVRRIFRRCHAKIPGREALERRARAALAAKALLAVADLSSRGRRREALAAAVLAAKVFPPLRRRGETWRLCWSVLGSDEFRAHVSGRALLRHVHDELQGSRLAARIGKLVAGDSAWQRTLTTVAGTVRRIVPRTEPIAVIDKHDPTILALSGRRGWHFPDWRVAPPGYPPTDRAAIAHLEQLRTLGARYLVVPSAFVWWLEHYRGLAAYLDDAHRKVWHDDTCVIYRLAGLTEAEEHGNRWVEVTGP